MVFTRSCNRMSLHSTPVRISPPRCVQWLVFNIEHGGLCLILTRLRIQKSQCSQHKNYAVERVVRATNDVTTIGMWPERPPSIESGLVMWPCSFLSYFSDFCVACSLLLYFLPLADIRPVAVYTFYSFLFLPSFQPYLVWLFLLFLAWLFLPFLDLI